MELVTPPEGSAVGERLSFEGLAGGPFEPVSAAQMDKKKVLEKILPVRDSSSCIPALDIFSFHVVHLLQDETISVSTAYVGHESVRRASCRGQFFVPFCNSSNGHSLPWGLPLMVC